MIEQFRANGKIELTVDVDGASQQGEKTTKHSAVNVRVDFPREEPERVCRYLNNGLKEDFYVVMPHHKNYDELFSILIAFQHKRFSL